MNNRRNFIKNSALALGATIIGQQSVQAETLTAKSKISIQQNDVILFQGDSITDHGRKRANLDANSTDAMGTGYAMIAASTLLNEFADKNIKIYNRGIGGNKVPQLQERWQADCIDLQPTILSIMIGVNDYWHKRNGNYSGSAKLYKEQYQKLIESSLEKFPNLKLIIAEPFAVKDVKHVDDSWFPEFSAYQQASKEVAHEFKATFIPYQNVFDKALKLADGGYWTTDGVHTTLAGANLMAKNWLQCISIK